MTSVFPDKKIIEFSVNKEWKSLVIFCAVNTAPEHATLEVQMESPLPHDTKWWEILIVIENHKLFSGVWKIKSVSEDRTVICCHDWNNSLEETKKNNSPVFPFVVTCDKSIDAGMQIKSYSYQPDLPCFVKLAPALNIRTRCHIFSVSKVDTVEQTFEADAYFECRIKYIGDINEVDYVETVLKIYGILGTVVPVISLLNSNVELERWTTYQMEHGCSYYDYTLKFRGKGLFTEEFELENFPFDEQALNITFTVLKSNEEFPSTFVRSNFQMSNVFSVSHQDMVLTSKSCSSAKESASGVVYPRFTFSVVLQRQPMYYLTNIALPMMLLTYLGFLSFAVSFDGFRLDTSDRLSITLTLLLTAVAYKFVVASAIPQVSYLTLLDKYISLCFAFLCLIITENALFPFFETRPGWVVTGSHELYVFFGLIGLFTLINCVWFLRFSYKLRCRAKLCRDINVAETVRRLVAFSYQEDAPQLRWTLIAAVLRKCDVDLCHTEEVQQVLGLAPEVVDTIFIELEKTFSMKVVSKSDAALLKSTEPAAGPVECTRLEEVLRSPRSLRKAVEQILARLKDLAHNESFRKQEQKLRLKRRVL